MGELRPEHVFGSAARALEFAFLPSELGAGFRPQFDMMASRQILSKFLILRAIS